MTDPRALDLACKIFQRSGAKLLVLHVSSHKLPLRAEREMAAVDDHAELAGGAGRSVDHGHPPEHLLGMIEREGIDLVVMGRRGLGDPAGMLLADGSHQVSHLADRACLTVK